MRSLHAVGRLDQNTSGLLLLTNDTRLSEFLTNPVHKIPRVYVAEVRGRWQNAACEKAVAGLTDGDEFLQVHQVEVLKCSGRESRILLTLCEGKNREVRRLCKCLGHEVLKLKRIQYGKLSLGDLPLGQWREVSRESII